jgi:hypothetical protein
MSGYGKKDEDADGTIVRVDRTAVFQEGWYHLWLLELIANAL